MLCMHWCVFLWSLINAVASNWKKEAKDKRSPSLFLWGGGGGSPEQQKVETLSLFSTEKCKTKRIIKSSWCSLKTIHYLAWDMAPIVAGGGDCSSACGGLITDPCSGLKAPCPAGRTCASDRSKVVLRHSRPCSLGPSSLFSGITKKIKNLISPEICSGTFSILLPYIPMT